MGITIKAKNKKSVLKFVNSLKLFGYGYSWGGFESLALPVDPARYRTATRWAAEGPAAALPLVDALKASPALENYHLLYGVRGDMLRKLGRHTEANLEFRRAAELTRNAREKAFLEGRAEEAV